MWRWRWWGVIFRLDNVWTQSGAVITLLMNQSKIRGSARDSGTWFSVATGCNKKVKITLAAAVVCLAAISISQ